MVRLEHARTPMPASHAYLPPYFATHIPLLVSPHRRCCCHLELPRRPSSVPCPLLSTICCTYSTQTGDAVVIFNFRADRVIELSKALE